MMLAFRSTLIKSLGRKICARRSNNSELQKVNFLKRKHFLNDFYIFQTMRTLTTRSMTSSIYWYVLQIELLPLFIYAKSLCPTKERFLPKP